MTATKSGKALSPYGGMLYIAVCACKQKGNKTFNDHKLWVFYIADVQWLYGVEWRLGTMPDNMYICNVISLNTLCFDIL